MEELKEKKEIIMAIREAIANMNLEEDIDIDKENTNIKEIEEKVLKLGGYYEKVGGLPH